ncbi:unnamed protein product [Cylindrotheca closterium]|uniref:Cytochrome P450 n=1 Tax=Cylindrotheca closterium TaxID=2856 RepID=A0AAD2FJD3_9STRA|nr:unnamed protein product [Cylindrotheca closterium]
MMSDLLSNDSSFLTLILTAGALIVVPSIIFFSSSKGNNDNNDNNDNNKSNIPWAPGRIPLLGHALKYKKDPGRFLLDSSAAVGDIFKINLAGKRMVVACGPRTQRIIATAPESVFSARQAVADVGFEQMLGPLNVHKGTDLHKGIVKGMWHDDADAHVRLLIQSIRQALQVESTESKRIQPDAKKYNADFMKFIRRVLLRTTIDRFIGSFFLDSWENFDFIDVFMKFQDDLEDVTAKSVILPRFLSLPLLLWPLARRRQKLQITIAERLKKTKPDAKDCGFWLNEVQTTRTHSIDDIAEFIVGLLFAAHKNPAIGAAQSYLMLVEEATIEEMDLCKKEAQMLVKNPSYQAVRESCPLLRRLCLESLRLTAHAIGGIRTAQKDFEIGNNTGKVITKGSTVALTHLSSSLDAKIWKEPSRFILDPKSKERSEELYKNEYTFSVFSHGVHKCPGQQLAVVMLECTVALLLDEYEIEFVKPLPPIDFERATLAQRSGPVLFSLVSNRSE